MSKQTVRLKTGGNPVATQDAKLFTNIFGEVCITTKTQWNHPVIGRFLGPKHNDGYVDIELKKDVYLVYQDGKRYTFTVGTSVEIEDI